MKLVLVEWIDAYGCSPEWESLENVNPRSMLCTSVGWLLHDGDDCKVIVPHVCEKEKQGCGDMTIPTIAIQKVTELLVPEKPRRRRGKDIEPPQTASQIRKAVGVTKLDRAQARRVRKRPKRR